MIPRRSRPGPGGAGRIRRSRTPRYPLSSSNLSVKRAATSALADFAEREDTTGAAAWRDVVRPLVGILKGSGGPANGVGSPPWDAIRDDASRVLVRLPQFAGESIETLDGYVRRLSERRDRHWRHLADRLRTMESPAPLPLPLAEELRDSLGSPHPGPAAPVSDRLADLGTVSNRSGSRPRR